MSSTRTSWGVAGCEAKGEANGEALRCILHDGGDSTSESPSTSNALNLDKSSVDALALLFEDEQAGKGKEALEERPALSLAGRLRLRLKSGGMEFCEPACCCILLATEL